MHHRARDIGGLRVGYLTALRYLGSDGRRSMWLTRCDCGVEKALAASELLKMRARGVRASCGCRKRETLSARRTSHGMSMHPAYAVYRSMRARCENPSHHAWRNYGGRGITVCSEWQESFSAFWRDMGPAYAPGLSLERTDNSKGYSPQNCRWATAKQQANNTRMNVRVGGQTAAQLADASGLARSTVYYRARAGVPTHRMTEAPDTTRKFST